VSRYEYSPLYGLQAGPVRQAGIMAVFERIIDRLLDKMPVIVVKWGNIEEALDLSDRITYEYPDEVMRLPHVVISLVSENMREPGIGRIMVDGDETLIGFTKILHVDFDIWARKSLERILVSDAIVHVLAQSADHFRQYGIRDLKHIGTQSRNYEQESSALYQRMTVQQASRVFRQLLQYEVEYDLVNAPAVEAEIIEQIQVSGDVSIGMGGEFEFAIGGLTELILDKEFVLTKELKGVIP
jgi:hypothetical protein